MPSELAHITARMDQATRDWIAHRAEYLGVSMGEILRQAIDHYRAGVESGRVPKPEPKPEPAKPKEAPKETPMPRKRNHEKHLTRPSGKPVNVDRWTCSECGSYSRPQS